ncbi:hypothetical protein M407DRAFT_27598 [Tulasnella calospora MUT 4182]|uniref:Uncharacterized protein n=1 Tax=Tulasnella calospora MUT 4182 TaxID=1051891 RepID=A0A0C3QC61_9AGAM|nr:hypothetical protein M407DRAFT_27598 [Tulasnella calospora MUT 4182]
MKSFTGGTLVGAIISVVTAAPALTAIDPPPTCTMIYGAPIMALSESAAVNYLQLTNSGKYSDIYCGVATLTDSGYHPQWDFTGGGIGVSGCVVTSPWLTIGSSNGPRKPLYWTPTEVTTSWDAAYFKNVTAKATSSYNSTSTFLACQSKKPVTSTSKPWKLYLLTDDTPAPSGAVPLYDVEVETCAKTQLFVEPIRG